MTTVLRITWFTLLTLLPVAALAADPLPSAEPFPVRVVRNVTYASPGGEALKLDLAVPKDGGPYPAVVMFHGGAWRMGGRADLSRGAKNKAGTVGPSAIEVFAARGYVVASVSYRLAPKHQFPAQIDDARAAVRFLRANAKTYNLDPDRIAAVGFSAGGHLALLLGLAPDPGEPSARVNCVVSYFGPTDLSLYAATPGIEEAYMVPLLGEKCRTDPAVYKRASPIDFVTKDAPPVLMIHGTADLLVPIIHSERLQKKLRDAGATADLLTVRGEGHGWSGPPAAATTAAALRFLDEQLRGGK